MRLSDLIPRKRHDICWAVLPTVLQDLAAPAGTQHVCDALCRRLETAERALVGRWLVKVAPLVPEAAQTGDEFRSYGNVSRRWIWSPRRTPGQSPALALAVEAASAGRSPELQALVEEFMRDCGCSEEVALPFAVEELEARRAATSDWSVTA